MFGNRTGKLFFVYFFFTLIWLLFILDGFFHFKLNTISIYPRTMNGLVGVFLSSFFHYDFYHIMSNTVPLFILMITMMIFNEDRFFVIFSLIMVGGNFLTWIFGDKSYHLGASGLVYGLFAFNLVFGFFKKRLLYLLMNIFLILIYTTSIINGLFPIVENISYISHWSGFFMGIVLAFFELKRLKPSPALI